MEKLKQKTQETKYFEVKKKYLAEALSFLGFRYYRFTNYKNQEVYSFEDTEKFRLAFVELNNLKNKLKN